MKRINTDIRWGWWKDTIPISILAVFTVLFFSDIFFGNKIFIHRDLLRFFYPLREFSVTQFKLGQIPLWNPYIHCGSPHLAEFQTCVFYPFSIIYLLFPFAKAFNYFIVFHVFLAGFFTYLLMRHWSYSRYASFLSASVFMVSGYTISVINLLASLGSVVWLPLIILFYDRKNYIWTGICLAFMVLGGGEPAIIFGTILILLFLGRHKALLISLLVAIGLTAFQILPFIEFLFHSSRPSMAFSEAAMWSLPPYALLDLLVPYLSETDYLYKDYWTRQSWLLVYYMGLFSIICAFISLKFNTTKRRKAFFYILAAGLVLSFGKYTPIYYLLYKLMPGFSLSRYPIKFFFMVTFSLAVLAGMGLDYYRQNVLALKRFLKIGLAIGFISSILYLLINLNFVEIYSFFYNEVLGFIDKKAELGQLVCVGLYNIKRGFGILMLLLLLMFLPSRKKIGLNIALPILIFISLIDIFTANKNLYLNMDTNDHLRPGESIEFLKKDNDLFRIFDSPATLRQNTFVPERDYFDGVTALKKRMVSNRGVSFGIYDAYGYGSLYNKRHDQVIEAITEKDLPTETNLLDLLNVKYVISPKDFEASGYRLVKKGEKANIYENENVLPRAFLVDKAVVIKDEKEILEKLTSKDFKPEEEVILEEGPRTSRFAPVRGRQGKVRILDYKANQVIVEAEVSSPKFLVLSDSYYPGWKAYVDGKQTKIYRADYILRAVHLEPGKHTVKFIYDPYLFKIGVIITFITLIVIMLSLRGWRSQPKQSHEIASSLRSSQ
ncbi:MAG: YfhO family protein [Candidatus Gorgyraea atricola]|nr:YfhO family protein [Candidatus Gorgyraea atricola]